MDKSFHAISPNVTQTPNTFFSAPITGRRIVAGFSHLQRIRKGATTSTWFPETGMSVSKDRIEWAAIRQFDILQEADNLHIYDMDVADIRFSLDNVTKMRAGGYRLTLLTLGQYTKRYEMDDLLLLDQKLQEEITRMIHFLYLNEMSEQATQKTAQDLSCNAWCVANNLEHVALTIQSKRLFKPERETLAEQTFFSILDRLPCHQIIHDHGVGLQLPDATKEKNWVYIAKGENQLWQFQKAITNIFENVDRDRPVMTHMRGYGDHTISGYTEWQRQSLSALAA